MQKIVVHGSEKRSGAMAFIGRCFRGPITVGKTFKRVGRGDREGEVVNLRIVRIAVYDHNLSQLDQGMTVCLILDGEIPIDLQDGSVLRAT